MDMDVPDASGCILWGRLPFAVQLHVLSLLPPNDRALSGRLTCRDASSHLSKVNTASLALPLPPHAPSWAQAAGRLYVQQVPFRRKLGLLCTAAASGCEANLEAALAVIQPSIFPEMLHSGNKSWEDLHSTPHDQGVAAVRAQLLGWLLRYRRADRHATPHDPGVAAVRAGHPQLLGWLLCYCPGLIYPQGVLDAAAQHCDVAGLQAAWEALRHWCSSSDSSSSGAGSGCTRGGNSFCVSLGQEVLDAAAQSPSPDAVPKMEWLLAAGGGSCHLRESTAAAAARSGDLGRLRWLHEHGCPMNDPSPMGSPNVLAGALQYADLAVAQWLVDEAGCALPSARGGSSPWRALLEAAARGSEAAAKIEWLEELLIPPWTLDDLLLGGTAYALVRGGQVEVLQHLQSRPGLVAAQGPEWWGRVHNEALASGSILLVEYRGKRACHSPIRPISMPLKCLACPWFGGWRSRLGCQLPGLGYGSWAKPLRFGLATRQPTGTCWRRCSCWWARRGTGGGTRTRLPALQWRGAAFPWCSTCCSRSRSSRTGNSCTLPRRSGARICWTGCWSGWWSSP